MIKKITFFLFLFLIVNNVFSAITIKKSSPVAKKEVEKMDTVSSIVPTAIGLYKGITDITAEHKALVEECIPTEKEISFVNNMVKEWAKTTVLNSDDIEKSLNRTMCIDDNTYDKDVKFTHNTEGMAPCYNTFNDILDKNKIWYLFPKASKSYYCKDLKSSSVCPKEYQVYVTDMYEIFNLIDFSDSDLLPDEIEMASKIYDKSHKCSNSVIARKKKEALTGFIMNSISNVGNNVTPSTGGLIQHIGGVAGQGPMGAIGSFGSVAAQFLSK